MYATLEKLGPRSRTSSHMEPFLHQSCWCIPRQRICPILRNADDDMIRAIQNIPRKTLPMDCVPTVVLKSVTDVFEHLIANLANLSFIERVFPSSFKVDQMVPLLKKSDASMEDISNYLQDSRKICHGADEVPHEEFAKPRPTADGVPGIAFHRDGHGKSGERFAVCVSLQIVFYYAVTRHYRSVWYPRSSLSCETREGPLRLRQYGSSVVGLPSFQAWTVCWCRQLPLPEGKVVLRPTAALGSRASHCYAPTSQHRSATSFLHSEYGTTNTPTTRNCTRSLIRRHQLAWRHSPHMPMQLPDGISEIIFFSTWSSQKLSSLAHVSKLQILTSQRESWSAVRRLHSARHFGSLEWQWTANLLLMNISPSLSVCITSIYVHSVTSGIVYMHSVTSGIDREAANTITCSIVCSRLNYCSSILYGVTKNNIGCLQRVHTVLERVVCGIPYRS